MDISFAGLILIIVLVCIFWSAIMTLKRIVNKALLKAEEASFIQEWKGKWDNKIDDKTGGASSNTQSNQTASTPALADDPFA